MVEISLVLWFSGERADGVKHRKQAGDVKYMT